MTHPPARQTVAPGCLPRHRHAQGYAAVVLAGAYEEAGDRGRRRVSAGDVVVHQPWDAHLNRTPRGAQVLNLPLAWPGPAAFGAAFGRVDDPDALARTAERDPGEAARRLLAEFRPAPAASGDWPDRLAAALAEVDALALRDWASALRLSPEHLSRGFGKVFGVTPQRFRWEARARAVLGDLAQSPLSLAELALAHGFADQAHMTRAVHALSGRPPGAWRASTAFKTAG